MPARILSGWSCPQAFNVLRYENGQHYDAHYDVFDPESYGPQPSQRVSVSRDGCHWRAPYNAHLGAGFPRPSNPCPSALWYHLL